MNIGVPKEVKAGEGRVALTPQACNLLCKRGQRCYVQHNAGLASGYSDAEYLQAGAHIAHSAQALYQAAELVIKVKEPIAQDLQHLKSHHVLFCFLHLAANPELQQQLKDIGLTAIAFETLESQGQLPILAPMSEIAGRVAIQSGAHLLHQHRSILLGGIRGTDAGQVTIVGAGNAGQQAMINARALGGNVHVFDINPNRLQVLESRYPDVHFSLPHNLAIQNAVRQSDMVIGAVLVTGAKAPVLISEYSVSSMAAGSVVIDISIDQGGCVEGIRATDYNNPRYIDHGVIHMAVTNLPGAVPRTASQALSQAIVPYALKIAEQTVSPSLESGTNICQGRLVHPALMAA